MSMSRSKMPATCCTQHPSVPAACLYTMCNAPNPTLLVPLCMMAEKMVCFITVMSHVCHCQSCISMLIRSTMMASPCQLLSTICTVCTNTTVPVLQAQNLPSFVQPHISGVYIKLSFIECKGNICFSDLCAKTLQRFLVSDATSESIQARYYIGRPITSALNDKEAADRDHVRADRCLLRTPACRNLLNNFTTYVKGDGKTVFEHAGVSTT